MGSDRSGCNPSPQSEMVNQSAARGSQIKEKIGRMAVLKNMRHKNIGSKLLRAAITIIQEAGNTPIGAQINAMGFYANHGFLPEGPVFDDAGIPHQNHDNHR